MIYHIYDKDKQSLQIISDEEVWIEKNEYNEETAKKASILVKENINSDDYLRIVLKYHNKNKNKLTHCFAMGYLESHPVDFILTDCVINPNPDIKLKQLIAERAIEFYKKLGVQYYPNIINFLTPNGHLSLSVPESVEAQVLCDLLSQKYDPSENVFDMKQLDYCLYSTTRNIKDGYLQWNIKTEHDRNANIMIVNNLCEGNSLFKCLLRSYNAMGFVLGADIPVILNSRSNLSDNNKSVETAKLVFNKE